MRPFRAVAGDEKKAPSIGRGQQRVDAMIAVRLDFAQQFQLVERVIRFRTAQPVNAAGNFVFIIVDGHVEGVLEPEQAVGGADRGRDFSIVCGSSGCPGGGAGKRKSPPC